MNDRVGSAQDHAPALENMDSDTSCLHKIKQKKTVTKDHSLMLFNKAEINLNKWLLYRSQTLSCATEHKMLPVSRPQN